jgi:hypothetical protein
MKADRYFAILPLFRNIKTGGVSEDKQVPNVCSDDPSR